ncbi:MAG: hypothetical protein QXU32_08235 [Nitrososphaerales archaeon]
MLIFSVRLHGEDILATQMDFIMCKPVIYYAKTNLSGEFLAYRNAGGVEDVALVDSIANPALVYAPIIHVKKFPSYMINNTKIGKSMRCISIKLKDLSSVAKVSCYKMIYEESPLPLFLFKNVDWILGTFMSADDGNGMPFFYYISMSSPPAQPFLKYSAQRAEKPVFTNNIDEHGYVYMKVIKLKKDHPLVMIDD